MIKVAVVDSGVFIGSKYPKDQYHKEALGILENFISGEIQRIYITDYVLAETISFLLSKAGFQMADGAFDYLTETENIEIVKLEDVSAIKPLFKRYKKLSITDCSLVALAEKLKIKEIFSFDKHFDSVKGITRLTSL